MQTFTIHAVNRYTGERAVFAIAVRDTIPADCAPQFARNEVPSEYRVVRVAKTPQVRA